MSRAAAALAVAVVGCGARPTAVTLPAGSKVLARGSLAYAVAFAGERVVAIELEERFALVVHELGGRTLVRRDLGPPERDLVALAIAGDTAWVGGDDQEVRAFALADGAPGPRWSIGADVTALAAVDGLLAIGDATGAVCVRRLADGALVQCLQLAVTPIRGLAAAGHGLVVTSERGREALTVPALRLAPAPPTTVPTVHGRELRRGATTLARLAGAIRAVAVDDQGRIAVASWIAGLADPSVVVLPR